MNTLRLLKTYIMFCSPAGAKYQFFKGPAHGLYILFPRPDIPDALLFLTPTSNSIKLSNMATKSKSVSKHSKILFVKNIESISIKEVNLSTKGQRHILKSLSKNEKLFKKLLWNSMDVLFWNQVWSTYKI